jgi:hypothetical protein
MMSRPLAEQAILEVAEKRAKWCQISGRPCPGSGTLLGSVLFLTCVLGLASPSWGQSDQPSWANLSALHSGQKIQIVDMKSKKHSGTFVSVSDTAISYRDDAGEQSIQKSEVRSVKASNHHRVRNTLLGGGIGAGVGAGISYAAWENHGFLGGKGTGAEIGALLGGVAGLTIGVLMPTNSTVYRVDSQ